MPKDKSKGSKSGHQLRHSPLGSEIEKPLGKLKTPTYNKKSSSSKNHNKNNDIDDDDYQVGDFDDDDMDGVNIVVPDKISSKIMNQAKILRNEMEQEVNDANNNYNGKSSTNRNEDDDSDYDNEEDEEEEYEDIEDEFVDFEGEYVSGSGLSDSEEAVIQTFLKAGHSESRSLADIIMEKLKEKEENAMIDQQALEQDEFQVPTKVAEVYTAVGQLLNHYKSGKLPKALKMLPHLKNWEHILWITRPDQWSPAATYAATRIFASNLNAKMAQRFYNLVLLEKCRDDIRSNNKLNYYLYLALKKALFKPAAFYKGLLLPLAQSRTCTLREATIIGSVLAKVSIQSTHSAVVLLRLSEMPYYGSNSFFIKILLNKKYALPRRVIDALVNHFCSFEKEVRVLPVVWHQSLLVFAQRYKFELNDNHRERFKQLFRSQQHHQITPEIRREIFQVTNNIFTANNSNINNNVNMDEDD